MQFIISTARVFRRSLNVTFETMRIREPTTNRTTYDLWANFTWEPPIKNGNHIQGRIHLGGGGAKILFSRTHFTSAKPEVGLWRGSRARLKTLAGILEG